MFYFTLSEFVIPLINIRTSASLKFEKKRAFKSPIGGLLELTKRRILRAGACFVGTSIEVRTVNVRLQRRIKEERNEKRKKEGSSIRNVAGKIKVLFQRI